MGPPGVPGLEVSAAGQEEMGLLGTEEWAWVGHHLASDLEPVWRPSASQRTQDVA